MKAYNVCHQLISNFLGILQVLETWILVHLFHFYFSATLNHLGSTSDIIFEKPETFSLFHCLLDFIKQKVGPIKI